MILIILFKFLVLLESILKLRLSSNSLIKSSFRPLDWVGSGLVGGCCGTLAFGRFLIISVFFSQEKDGVW